MLGDVQFRPQLDHVDHPFYLSGRQLVLGQIMEITIHPQADPNPVTILFDVNIAGFFAHGIQQDGLVDRHQIGADVLVFRIVAQQLINTAVCMV